MIQGAKNKIKGEVDTYINKSLAFQMYKKDEFKVAKFITNEDIYDSENTYGDITTIVNDWGPAQAEEFLYALNKGVTHIDKLLGDQLVAEAQENQELTFDNGYDLNIVFPKDTWDIISSKLPTAFNNFKTFTNFSPSETNRFVTVDMFSKYLKCQRQ